MAPSGNHKLAWLLLSLLACRGPSNDSSVVKMPVGSSPQRGPSTAWVTVIEFADYGCEFCRGEEAVLANVRSAYGADLRIVFKNFPQSDAAEAAAIAAECAHEQGQAQFWHMHDLLLQSGLDPNAIAADASQVSNLDLNKWQMCLNSPAPATTVANDAAVGKSVGINRTPTLIVNGELVVGSTSESDLSARIDRERAKAEASGVSCINYYDQVVLGE